MKKSKVNFGKLEIKKETITPLQNLGQVEGGKSAPSASSCTPTWCCPTVGEYCGAVTVVVRSFVTACKSCGHVPGQGLENDL